MRKLINISFKDFTKIKLKYRWMHQQNMVPAGASITKSI
jgi:hypothetical protein